MGEKEVAGGFQLLVLYFEQTLRDIHGELAELNQEAAVRDEFAWEPRAAVTRDEKRLQS